MKYLAILSLMLVFLFPDVTSAASGLVPCDGLDCNFCHVVDLGNNVIKWLIGVLMLVFAIMAVSAGFGLVTSGGNTAAKETAKSKFTNAIIGLVIVLAAWLIVDTVMRALLNGGTGTLSNGVYTGSGPWSQIECVAPKVPTVGQAPTTPTTPTTPPPTATTTPGACAVAPLTPISDPLAQQMESGTKVIWANTNPQLQICAQKAGFTVVSAYRPPAYQTHLKEVHTKWCVNGLQNNTDPACSAVKSAVSAEMAAHGLSCSRPVATVSNHSNGTAIDISGGGGMPAQCLRWFGAADPVHYTLMPNCTCN